MTVTQTIPNTRLTGQQTFTFLDTTQEWHDALLTIDRTVSGGLNSLTSADTLTVSIDYSTDGGATWLNIAGVTLQGGLMVTKGVTQTQDTLGVGIGKTFQTGTGFRVNTTVNGAAVRIAGTVVYE